VKLKNPKRILCISLPGIGDALLSTPIIVTLKRAYPSATIDVIVRSGREDILKDNPDIQNIFPFPPRPTVIDHFKLIRLIFWKYDLAVSTSPSDRSYLLCLVAAPRRANIVPRKRLSHYWKYLLGDQLVPIDEQVHAVVQNLELLKPLQITTQYSLSVPRSAAGKEQCKKLLEELKIKTPFVVVHVFPGSDYKFLPASFWKSILQHLAVSGYTVLLSGGRDRKEKEYCDGLALSFPDQVFNICGKLDFSAISEIIDKADFFIGNDTSTTHLAAGSGKLTFAVYGPSNVVKWSPWPKGYSSHIPPFKKTPGIQRAGNVVVIQANCKCLDFNRKCRLSSNNLSLCLQKMNADLVVEAIQLYAASENSASLSPNAELGETRPDYKVPIFSSEPIN